MSESNKEIGKLTDFTIDEIKDYLADLKRLILDGQYIVSRREKNDAFAFEYRVDTAKEKEILLNLHYKDFCYVAENRKTGYEHERLYVFCKEYELDHWGNLELVEIYIKTNLTQTKSGKDFMVVISLHRIDKLINYLFR